MKTQDSLFARGALTACLLLPLLLGGCSKPEPDTGGSPEQMRLISKSQYVNTLSYLFGADIKIDPQFPPVIRKNGMAALGAESAGVTAGSLAGFYSTAWSVASQVVDPAHRHILIECEPASAGKADDACARQFLERVARLLYRRPAGEARLARLVNVAGTAANDLGDFHAGIAVALSGILIDPDFMMIADRSEPDPERSGQRRLDEYSLATRLSLLLWNAFPDDALLQAAQRGELREKKSRARVVERMLASPRLEEGVRAFFDDTLDLHKFDTLSKDGQIYPAYLGTSAVDAREHMLRTIVDHVLTGNGDYRDLFTTRRVYLTPMLATLYELPAPNPGWTAYEFPEDSRRAGLLTHVGFLSLHAHPGRSSATLRGRAIREQLLCQQVPSPPPNVDFSIVEDPNAHYKTARERLGAHNTDPTCAGCHKIMDPMGLALEHFDGAGQFRETEKGAPIDASGTLDGRPFDGAVGLGQALHDHPALVSCLVGRIYSYATGGPVAPGSRELIAYFTERFAQDKYRLTDLFRAIALSSAITTVSQDSAAAAVADLPPT